jgi:GntR family transcriptional regulator
MLGVSRGTLRTALERLEKTGEIVRRQGSGTFVGRVTQPAAFHEGLERLESYSSLARKRGVKLGVRDLRIEPVSVSADLARVLGVEPGTPAITLSRVVVADGEPAAMMVDTVHPDMPLPTEGRVRRAIERGDMVLDVLMAQSVPIAYATTRIVPRLLAARERAAKVLGVSRSTAVLDLQETFHLASGEVTHHSSDLFAPDGLDLRVVRFMAAAPLPQVGGGAR